MLQLTVLQRQLSEREIWKNEEDFTSALVISEEIKTLPFDAIWEKYCEKQGVIADDSWFEDVKKYEQEVLLKRQELI